MHNLRAGANSAWACSVPPNPVSSVGRPMAPRHRRFRDGNCVVPELNSTTSVQLQLQKVLKNE